ncbi:polysaccharide lyase [Flaviaesturariibacter amylovorans]|uniref:Polysaccharide lyase 14 domain-containing protein n=1 Tax=Flaviaesturariibacter amylovorans TaxID=1084520 RepID=A0ABP8HEM6_9BACT
MKTNTRTFAAIASILFTATTLVSCSKEDIARPASATESNMIEAPMATDTSSMEAPVPNSATALASTTTTGTTAYKIAVNYTGRANSIYGLTQSATDYKTVSYWNGGTRSNISNGTLTTKLARNVVGVSGGTMSKMNTPDAAEYTVTFRMMFASNFDFSYGGKVGFGLLLGNGYTGGTPGWDGKGGSARIMWYKGKDGRVYLKPYIYHKDQPTQYGNDFGKTYPATGSIAKGVWHTVKMYVKSNSGSNTDGRITITINGVTLIDQAIRWTTVDANRLVNNVVFETFRGGAESYWQSSTDGIISFNNITYGVGKF